MCVSYIKSINATMLKVDCGVVPLEGNWVTKVNKEGVACDKAIVINVCVLLLGGGAKGGERKALRGMALAR